MTFLSIPVLVLLTWLQLWSQIKRCDTTMRPIGFWIWPTGTRVKVKAVESNSRQGEVSFLLTLLANRSAFRK